MKHDTKKFLGVGAAALTILAIGAIISMNAGNLNTTKNNKVDEKLLSHADSHSTANGPYDYKINLVEFGDYECPGCAFMHQVLQQILSEYPRKISLVYRNYLIHKTSKSATLAAEAAGEQGKFWEMHDKLYENQQIWSKKEERADIFAEYAKELGLDMDKFNKSLTDQKMEDRINLDQADYTALQIQPPHTPTIFINGIEYTGDLSYPAFKAAIEEALKKP